MSAFPFSNSLLKINFTTSVTLLKSLMSKIENIMYLKSLAIYLVELMSCRRLVVVRLLTCAWQYGISNMLSFLAYSHHLNSLIRNLGNCIAFPRRKVCFSCVAEYFLPKRIRHDYAGRLNMPPCICFRPCRRACLGTTGSGFGLCSVLPRP